MVIVDFSAIAFGDKYVKEGDLHNTRVVLLAKLAQINKKYGPKYGQMYIACDNGSWRRRVFPEYKAGRKKARAESDVDWPKVFENINVVLDEIRANIPWIVVSYREAEGDDVVATIAKMTQEFGAHEEVMIIAADKDFIQLQRYGNVTQMSTITHKLVKPPKECPTAIDYLRHHIIKAGDDGIPNILSDDDTFITEGKRQVVMSALKLKNFKATFNTPEVWPEDIQKNFKRNRQMVDFDYIPDDVTEGIINIVSGYKPPHKTKVLNYLVKNRCRTLIPRLEEFYSHAT